MSNLTYVFVHGLAGWGRYDEKYARRPYWGMSGGDLMAHLREQGYACYAASVSPMGSAWDRACELYAQIAGTRVDYGAAHAAEYGHERFGRDFSGDPLIPSWDDGTRLVLVGHSFGGATARLFSELLANGDEAERAATDPSELSPLFVGGMAERIHAVPLWTRVTAKIMTAFLKTEPDGRDPRDYAAYDMHVDHALELNGRISTLPHVYYLSVPCTTTVAVPDGTHVAKRWTEPLFTQRAFQIGAYTGKTAGGVEIDTSWCENDGLVNTISEKAPLGAPSKPFDRKEIEAGMWNVLPTLEADHMWLQGGLMRKHDIRDFYTRLIKMIDALA